MSRDHAEIVVSQFNGLYDRGFGDVCPPDHFTGGKNFSFTQDGPKTRCGLVLANAVENAVRTALYRRLDEVPRRLILDNAGNLFDSLDLGIPILTIAGMTDFACLTFGNRAYISPHDGVRGLENEVVYVYDGVSCRPAAGNSPSGSISAVNSALSGNIDAGVHLVAIAYETESGFITLPGPTLYAQFTATGDKQVDVSGVPIGPAGTLARRVLSTRRIPAYDGNQNAYTFYFVPEGRIANNVDTTVTLNYYDADLVQEADYLFDQLQTIPAGVALAPYRGRVVVMGTFDGPSVAWFSKENDPESFDAVEGFKEVDLSESGGINGGVEFRDTFYITKNLHTYATTGTDDAPIFWQIVTIDGGVGSLSAHGISVLLESSHGHSDAFLVASHTGLMKFNGAYVAPEFSWKIRDYWQRINPEAYSKVQLFIDSVSSLIFVNVPLDNATECTHVIVGDYKNGMEPLGVRWSIYEYPDPCHTICLDIDENGRPFLLVSQEAGIYDTDQDATDDYGNAIETVMKTAYLGGTGQVQHFHTLRLRVRGTGELQVKLYGEDDVVQNVLQDATLAANPGRELVRLSNHVNEKCAVELRTNLFGEVFNINHLILYSAPLWVERPM